ncbi:MAG: hypothetical protein AAGA77_05530 [Bacteroidota bacterium]
MLTLTSVSHIACTSDKVKISSIITEVYEVHEGANNEYAKGRLKYMEIENFENDRMINKTFYNGDNTVRGKEIFDYEGDSELPSGSKYYNQSGVTLSTYKFEYRDALKIKSEAFEGTSNNLLRIEGFQYDDSGHLTSKTIYNNLSQKQKSFAFTHDAAGNEVQMNVLDQDDNRLLTESYEIVSRTKDGEWVEKWGYLNDSTTPVTFYQKRKG